MMMQPRARCLGQLYRARVPDAAANIPFLFGGMATTGTICLDYQAAQAIVSTPKPHSLSLSLSHLKASWLIYEAAKVCFIMLMPLPEDFSHFLHFSTPSAVPKISKGLRRRKLGLFEGRQGIGGDQRRSDRYETRQFYVVVHQVVQYFVDMNL